MNLSPPGEHGEPSPLSISVTVPARDEARTLRALLDSLIRQSLPPTEIIVADAGSRDDTAAIATGYALQGVRVLRLEPSFPGGARNAAILASRSDWIALVDAGCVAEPDWLRELAKPLLSDPRLEAVFGDHSPLLRTEWDRAQALALMAPREPAHGIHGPSTASMLVRRGTWSRCGGFREDLRAAEDLVFFRRLRELDARTTTAPAAGVSWALSAGPWAAFRRLCLYSQHHVRAGLFRTWHLRVMAMDLAALLAVAVLPLAAGATLAVAALVGRTVATAWRRRTNVPGGTRPTPTLLLRVAVLLLLADIAVWWGALGGGLQRLRHAAR
jgi:glycosyltransferase involved in cell wall biosynthesis